MEVGLESNLSLLPKETLEFFANPANVVAPLPCSPPSTRMMLSVLQHTGYG